jgi:PAS domain S-box-containing protein
MLAALNDRREIRDVWIAIILTILIATDHLVLSLAGHLDLARPDLFQWTTHLLLFWILGLLWVAYRRWRRVGSLEADLHAILSSISTEVIMLVDRERRVRMANDGVMGIFGYQPAEVIGQTTDLLYGDRRIDKQRPNEIRDDMDRIGFHLGTAVGRRKTGETMPLEIVTALLRGREGAVVIIRDVTERQRWEEAVLRSKHDAEKASAERGRALAQLEEQYRKLQDLEHLRDNLTHMIVHDLRTPLQAVLGNIELVVRYPQQALHAEDKARLVEALARADVLTMMIRAVLDVSRLEAHQFPLEKIACDLTDIGRDAITAIGPPPENIRVFLAKTTGTTKVSCDRDAITRVVTNLLTNAVKHAPPDSTVTLSTQTENGRARLSVTDTGPGIARQYHDKIFEKFGAAEIKKGRAVPSIGLGLAYCKLAVEAHGGAIGVESQPGKGSTFWFELPA